MAVIDQPIPPAIVCTLKRDEIGDSIILHGSVISREDVSGNYRLKVTKSGPAGSTNLNQSGRFSATANTETNAGSVTISVEQGAQYDAQLVIEADNQTYQCGAPSGGKI